MPYGRPKRRPRADDTGDKAEADGSTAAEWSGAGGIEEAMTAAANEALKEVAKHGPLEREQDAEADTRPKISQPIVFHTHDTTLNACLASNCSLLTSVNEGGLQHFLAGARASVGIRSGRYMFEVKVIEQVGSAEAQKGSMPRHMFRIGFTTAGASPIVGDSAEGCAFDSEGKFCHDSKRTHLMNPVYGTQHVFALVLNLEQSGPSSNTLSLFKNGERVTEPHPLPENLQGQVLYPTVAFRGVTVHVNFGNDVLKQLPFVCRMVQDAAAEDTQVAAKDEPQNGRWNAIFPVFLPDEGTFEWVDKFLKEHPTYQEISDRVIVNWAKASGLPHRVSGGSSSRDKPDMNYGVKEMEDNSLRGLLSTLASLQERHLVIMEIKNNLLKDERAKNLRRFRLPLHKKIARVMVGRPPEDIMSVTYKVALEERQESINNRWATEKRMRQMEIHRESKRRKLEAGGDKKSEDLTEAGVGEDNVAEDDIPDDQLPEVQMDPPALAVLTDEEKMRCCRKPQGKASVPDLTPYVLNMSFPRFCFPATDESFDEISYDWDNRATSEGQLRDWKFERKLTTRIEDLQPGDWFRGKWQEWQKELLQWHAKHVESKDPAKKTATAKSAAAPKAAALALPPVPDKKEEEKKKSPMDELEEYMDKQDFDVFEIDDVCDVNGTGDPLFASFTFEDWALLGLRFELHLLAHSFKKDCTDHERRGIHMEHLQFYYTRYYKKSLQTKDYGCDNVEDLCKLVKDTIVVDRRLKHIDSQLGEDMESNGIFVKLTEEARRDRQCKVDSGDLSAAIKFPVRQQALPPSVASSALTKSGAPAPVSKSTAPTSAVPPPAPAAAMAQPKSAAMASGGTTPKAPAWPAAPGNQPQQPGNWNKGWGKGSFGGGGWGKGKWPMGGSPMGMNWGW
eukprot:TRINITY_DN4720_c0_g1_i1.p1 TRINITY_DN4720_c0_g1~~TRINITY_DN4720_c0_g1_i1.p1  ORF type:complete len:902 (-),score=255.78 TRINITY_DN4720_c0_g1_i1:100-2805(-)